MGFSLSIDNKMADLKIPEMVVAYLISKGYKKPHVVSPRGNPVISFAENFGDGSWEKVIAYMNNWAPQERLICCRFFSQDKPESNYCSQCGAGINGTVTYARDDLDLSSLERLFAKVKKEI